MMDNNHCLTLDKTDASIDEKKRQFILTKILLASGMTIQTPLIFGFTEQENNYHDDFWQHQRTLWIKRPWSQEQFRVVYWVNGQVDLYNYARLSYILRDATENVVAPIDVNLLHLLYAIQRWQDLLTQQPSPLLINSGYRTVAHNQRLEGAAKNSFHLHGKAADIVAMYISPKTLAKMAMNFSVGGVGQYRSFTHIDTGHVRFWHAKK